MESVEPINVTDLRVNQRSQINEDLYLQTQFGEDRCTQFRVIVVTDPQTNKQTETNTATHPQTGPITIHCAAAS